VREESLELIEASEADDTNEIVHEAADLLFHTLVLLAAHGGTLEELIEELERRRRHASE